MVVNRGIENLSLAEVSQHRTEDDLWIAVHGKVYNLTTFASDHPGGTEILLDCGGTDASETYDYAGHSDGAAKTLEKFQIGILSDYKSVPGIADKIDMISKRAISPKTYIFGISTIDIAPTSLILIILILGVASCIVLTSRAAQGQNSWIGTSIAADEYLPKIIGPFWAGIVIASSASCLGAGMVYSRLLKTLDHEADVFSYPAVISRRTR